MHTLHQVGFTTPENHFTGDRADYHGLFRLIPPKQEAIVSVALSLAPHYCVTGRC